MKDDMEKVKFSNRKKKSQLFKKKAPQRPSIVSNYSVVSLSDVTEESLEVWRGLPEKIRQDPSLASFRKKHERLHGSESDNNDSPDGHVDGRIASPELDPLDYFSDDDKKKDIEMGNLKRSASEDDEQVFMSADGKIHEEINIMGHHKPNKYIAFVKVVLLLVCWGTFTYFLTTMDEKVLTYRHIAISEEEVRSYILNDLPIKPKVKLSFKGAFLSDHYNDIASNYMYFYLSVDHPEGHVQNISKLMKLPLVDASEIDSAKEIKRSKTIALDEADYAVILQDNSTFKVNLVTNLEAGISVNLLYDPSPLDKGLGILFATLILLGLYILIIWELVHRTFAAMVASTMAIGVLAAMHERPTMAVVVSWIDVETLLLLFGMMILVAVLSETGAFDYLAVYAFKITNGKVWQLILCLCLFTGIVSSFLDNVTTILLMTPVTIRLCEVMELNPVPVLMFTVIYSNIGGALTPVGDPPNVIIASNSHISKNGVNFTNFTMHMSFAIIAVMIQTWFQLRWMFKSVNDLRFSEPKDIQELRHEITVWQRASATLSSFSKDEDVVRKTLVRKVERLNQMLTKKLLSGSVPTETYKATLEELQAKYPIKNMKLLLKSAVALVFVISFFFLHSVPNLQKLSLGWTALLGAVLLLILYDREDLDAILAHVEWSTLLFFAALFVLMEALTELGLIEWIGDQTVSVILAVGEGSRLAVAILIILWVSALASAFVDNIPLTTMMVKIVISLAENETLGLPLHPLVWALALGACLGGNGTLIGASANVVCAGVAEQHGYKFSFVEFFKVGFPVMIGGIVVSTIYLMIAHVLFTWH